MSLVPPWEMFPFGGDWDINHHKNDSFSNVLYHFFYSDTAKRSQTRKLDNFEEKLNAVKKGVLADGSLVEYTQSFGAGNSNLEWSKEIKHVEVLFKESGVQDARYIGTGIKAKGDYVLGIISPLDFEPDKI